MQRYNRQLRYHTFEEDSQGALSNTTTLILGAGVSGSHVAEPSTCMGAHHLVIVDMDIVELSNLHCQALHTENDAHHMVPKAHTAKQKIEHINLNINVRTCYQEIDSVTTRDILKAVNPGIIIDGMSHFKIRCLIDETCHRHHTPWVYGVAAGSKGTVYGIDSRRPCLKCLLEHIPINAESCVISGVLSPVITQVASYEVAEMICHLPGRGFSHKLIAFDAFYIDCKALNTNILKDDERNICGEGHYGLLETKQQQNIESLCGKTYLFRYQLTALDCAEHSPSDIVRLTLLVRLIRDGNYETTLFRDGRMNAYGVKDSNETEQLYHRYLKSSK